MVWTRRPSEAERKVTEHGETEPGYLEGACRLGTLGLRLLEEEPRVGELGLRGKPLAVPHVRDLVRALNAAGCETSYVNIETDKGHDAFFVEEPEFEAGLRGFIDAAAQARGLGAKA